MSLSFLDAFGATAAPGAPPGAPPCSPPLSALAGDAGPIDGGGQDATFVALLDAAGTEPNAADAAGAGSHDAPISPGATLVPDPALAAVLQARWWLTGVAVPEPAVDAGSALDSGTDEAAFLSDPALDPDDNAAAEWFIASGALLTNLVVVDEVPAAQTAARGSGVALDADGESPIGDTTAQANGFPPANEIAARARHDAGLRRSSGTADGRPADVLAAGDATANAVTAGDVAAAAHETAADSHAIDGQPAMRAASESVTGRTREGGEPNPAGEGPGGPPVAPVASQAVSNDQIDRTSNGSSSPVEHPAKVSDVPKAAQDGPEAGVLTSAEAQAKTEERRGSVAAAARLASSIERGGGATAVPTGALPRNGETKQAESSNSGAGNTPSAEAIPIAAALESGSDSPSGGGAGDHPSESREGRILADVAATTAPRAASAATAGDVPAVASAPPATPAPAATVMSTVPGAAMASTSTPSAETLPQMVQAIRLQYRAGGGEAVVRLNPEHLGAVSISLRVDRGVVSATVHAESPAVRQWLEQHESSLRDGLSGHGLHLDRFVVHRDGRQPEQRHYEDPQRQRRRAPRRQAGQEPATFEVRV